MSIRINWTLLTKAQRDKVKKDLTFHAKPKFLYIGGRRRAVPSKESLQGYILLRGSVISKLNLSYTTDAEGKPVAIEPMDQIRVPRLYGIHNFPSLVLHNIHWTSINIEFTGSLLPKQVEPVNNCLQQVIRDGASLMAFCTGFGKSVCMAYMAAYLHGFTLFLVDGTVGNTQIPETLRKFTNANIWVVGEKAPSQANIVVCMNTRIDKIPIEYMAKFTTVFIDEAHCWLTQKRYSILQRLEPRYLILATSTPRDQYGLWPALQTYVGENSVVEIFDRPFNVYIYHTGVKVEKVQGKRGTDWARLVTDLTNSEERNRLILKLVRENIENDYKILILTWREPHAEYLTKEINKMDIPASKFTGKTKTYSDANCIIGTIAKINKAFDEQTMCPDFAGIRINLVMLVGSTKNDTLLEQMVGRGFRAECPNIIHLVDNIDTIKRHLYSIYPWYKDSRRRASIYEIHIDKPEKNKLVQGDSNNSSFRSTIQNTNSSSYSSSSSSSSGLDKQLHNISSYILNAASSSNSNF